MLPLQDVNWMYIRRSDEVLDVFWTSYVLQIMSCVYGVYRRNGDTQRFSTHQNVLNPVSRAMVKIFFAVSTQADNDY